METPKSYICPSCGYIRSVQFSESEIADCIRIRHERRMSRIRLIVIVVACITLPILVWMMLSLMP